MIPIQDLTYANVLDFECIHEWEEKNERKLESWLLSIDVEWINTIQFNKCKE